MARIPDSVTVTGFIAPSDSADTYATHDEDYGRGGYRTVADTTERDAITDDRRVIGMMVNTASDGKVYRLIGGTANSNWVEFNTGGGSSLWEVVGGVFQAIDSSNSSMLLDSQSSSRFFVGDNKLELGYDSHDEQIVIDTSNLKMEFKDDAESNSGTVAFDSANDVMTATDANGTYNLYGGGLWEIDSNDYLAPIDDTKTVKAKTHIYVGEGAQPLASLNSDGTYGWLDLYSGATNTRLKPSEDYSLTLDINSNISVASDKGFFFGGDPTGSSVSRLLSNELYLNGGSSGYSHLNQDKLSIANNYGDPLKISSIMMDNINHQFLISRDSGTPKTLSVDSSGKWVGNDANGTYDLYQPTSTLYKDTLTGFDIDTGVTLSFTDATRTLTLTKTGTDFSFYSDGTLYTKTANDSIVIDDTEGLVFIYYDGSGVLQSDTFNIDMIRKYALVATVNWDATNKKGILVANEMHGWDMDNRTHEYLHFTKGTAYERDGGLGLANMVVDGSGDVDSHAQFSVTNGSVWDEDIQHLITNGSPQTLSPIAQIPVYYRLGTNGDWRKATTTNFPIITTGTGRAAYNKYDGTTWTIEEVTNNDFLCMHYYATGSITEPIIGIMGQELYTRRGAAKDGAAVEVINIAIGDIPIAEMKVIATVLWQTGDGKSNAVKSSVESPDDDSDYIDWRLSDIGSAGSGDGLDSSPLTTKGDLYAFDTGDTRLPVGTDGYVLSADSSETTGLKWVENSDVLWKSTSGVLEPKGSDTIINLPSGGYYKMDSEKLIGLVGSGNVFIGKSGNNAVTGYHNFGAGSNPLALLTTGLYNTAISTNSLYSLTTGSYNSAFSAYSLYNLIDGDYNYGAVFQSLNYLKHGNRNSAIGYRAGWKTKAGALLETANNCLYLGGYTTASADNASSETVIGVSGQGMGNNTTTIGGSSNTATFLTGGLFLKEQANKSTQVSGYGQIFTKSDDHIYALKSDGTSTEYLLTNWAKSTNGLNSVQRHISLHGEPKSNHTYYSSLQFGKAGIVTGSDAGTTLLLYANAYVTPTAQKALADGWSSRLYLGAGGLYFDSSSVSNTANTDITWESRFKVHQEGGFLIYNRSTDPSTPTSSSNIYSKSGEMYVQDASGNVTKISPHNEVDEWEYYSKNTRTGKVIRINMEKMVRKLEEFTGETFIEEI